MVAAALDDMACEGVALRHDPAVRAIALRLAGVDDLEIVFPAAFPTPEELLAEAERAAWTMPDRARRNLTRLVGALAPRLPPAYFLASPQCPPLLLRGLAAMMAQRMAFVGRLVVVAYDEGDLARLNQDLEGTFPALSLREAAEGETPSAIMLPHGAGNGPPPLSPEQNRWLTSLIFTRPIMLNVHGLGNITPLKASAHDGRLELGSNGADPHFHPHRDANAFTRALVRHDSMYGSLHGLRVRNASNGMGPIDAYGFRIGGELGRYEGRPRSHLVVTMFGGSATHGDKCFHDDTIPARLEATLDARCREAGLQLRVSVLNFGVSTWMARDELQAFLIHCLKLAPEIVISHTGFNDAYMGMNCDPKLLSERALPYDVGEFDAAWGPDAKLKGNFNDPALVLDAMRRRAEQFRRVAEAHGAQFVHGVQPASFGRVLAPGEARAVAAYNRDLVLIDKDNALRLKRLGHIYPMLQASMARCAAETGMQVVDCHAHLGTAAPGEDLFFDIAHLTPRGNQIAAELYADRLMPILERRAQEIAHAG